MSTNPGRDQVYADGRELEREVPRHGGKRRRERRDQRESHRRATATGAAHEEQAPSRANLARGVPGDLQRQQQMRVDVAACLFDVELRQRRVVGTGSRHQHMIDRRGQLVEESLELFEGGGVEGGGTHPELAADALQAIGSRAVTITSAPSARARRAVSRPMPELPPITTTVCPSSSGLPLMLSPPPFTASRTP